LAHSGGGSLRPGSALDDWLRAEEQIREAEERAVDTGRVLRRLEGHSSSVSGVAMTPDGKRAVSASWDNQIGRNLTDALDGILNGKRYLIHDRDPLFTTSSWTSSPTFV
jgi:WD40 repeat protein